MKPQIATTKEQSARILACGVKPEPADMCYSSGALSLMEYRYEVKDRDSRRANYEIIPAWSLSALLALLPKEIYDENDDMYYMRLSQCFPLTDEYATEYVPAWFEGKELVRKRDNNPIEATVQLIEWLTSSGYSLNNTEQ